MQVLCSTVQCERNALEMHSELLCIEHYFEILLQFTVHFHSFISLFYNLIYVYMYIHVCYALIGL